MPDTDMYLMDFAVLRSIPDDLCFAVSLLYPRSKSWLSHSVEVIKSK